MKFLDWECDRAFLSKEQLVVKESGLVAAFYVILKVDLVNKPF